MIQYHKFHDGGFVLHKVVVNGNKYSAWFGADGKIFSAERFSKDNTKSYHVDTARQHEVARQLEQVARRYTK